MAALSIIVSRESIPAEIVSSIGTIQFGAKIMLSTMLLSAAKAITHSENVIAGLAMAVFHDMNFPKAITLNHKR